MLGAIAALYFFASTSDKILNVRHKQISRYKMKLIFKVQGSALEPYIVEFWREGNNLTTNCSCPTGENKMYCKHRLNLIGGNSINLISKNIEDIERLRILVQGTDVEETISSINKSENAIEELKFKYNLTPDKRRCKTNIEQLKTILLDDGYAKGIGETNKLDIYDKNNSYVGSITLNGSIFKDDLKNYVTELDIKKYVKSFNRMQGVYYFLTNSYFDCLLTEESKLNEYKQKLKVDLKD
jgi:hypothetical protein